MSGRSLFTTAAAFVFDSVLRSVPSFGTELTMRSIDPSAFRRPAALALAFAYLAFLTLAIARSATRRSWRSLGWLLFIAVMVAFYSYFNPGEAMLYSTQCLFPLALVFARDFQTARFRYKYVLLIAFLVGMGWHNARILEWS